MSRIAETFAELRTAGRKAFIPFVTAGDPDLDYTAEVIRLLDARGATLCEIGIPYSDPIADGPVIQDSYTRALEHRIRLADIAATLRSVADLATPRLTMVSYAIIHRRGPQQYVELMREAGVAGLIVPDLPWEEADALAATCRGAEMDLVQLVAPTTSPERCLRIAEQSTGFLYFVSVAGVTGERRDLPPELLERVAWLREQTTLPICIGFGINTPEQVRALSAVADGVIVGSALVRRIAEASQDRAKSLADIRELVDSLVAALHATP